MPMNIPVGRALDTEICRRVFGVPEWKIRLLGLLRMLPRYSTNWSRSLDIVGYFYGLPADSPVLLRYNSWFQRLGASPKGLAGTVVTCACPCNVCDAALFAVSGVVAD